MQATRDEAATAPALAESRRPQPAGPRPAATPATTDPAIIEDLVSGTGLVSRALDEISGDRTPVA